MDGYYIRGLLGVSALLELVERPIRERPRFVCPAAALTSELYQESKQPYFVL